MVRHRTMRDGRGRRALLAGFTATLLLVVVAIPSALAASSWKIVASPSTVTLGTPATVTLAITNTSSAGTSIACVTVAIPTAYKVNSVSVASVSNDLPWTALVSAAAPRGIVATADLIGDGLHPNDVLVLKVKVTGTVEGAAAWTANAFTNVGCIGNLKKPITIAMAVAATPTPTPTRTPSPTATTAPSPTPTRTPSPTATPTATGTPAPTPTATATPTPTASPAPTGRPTANPTPDQSPSTGPGSGSTGQGGTGAGSTGKGGSAGAGDGGTLPPPSPLLDLGGRTPVSFEGLDLGGSTGFGAFEWAVPGAILTGPGLLLVALIAAQAMGALAWLPLVRRRIGAFGPARWRRSARGA